MVYRGVGVIQRANANDMSPIRNCSGTSGIVGFETASFYETGRIAKSIVFLPRCGSLIVRFAVFEGLNYVA